MNVMPKPEITALARRLLQPELEPYIEVSQAHACLAQLVVDHLPHARALLHEHERLRLELVERDGPVGEAVPRGTASTTWSRKNGSKTTPRWRRTAPTTPSSTSRRATCSITRCVSETESATCTPGWSCWNSASATGEHAAARPVEAPI